MNSVVNKKNQNNTTVDIDGDDDHDAWKKRIQLEELKLNNYIKKGPKITSNLSRHYVFSDSLINSNYVFHHSPVHAPNS